MKIKPAISPFEVDVIRKLDRELRAYYAEKDKPEEKSIVQALAAEKQMHDNEKRGKAKKK